MRGTDVDGQPAGIIGTGSRSILGSWSDEYLPDHTIRSPGMDVAFMPEAGNQRSLAPGGPGTCGDPGLGATPESRIQTVVVRGGKLSARRR